MSGCVVAGVFSKRWGNAEGTKQEKHTHQK